VTEASGVQPKWLGHVGRRLRTLRLFQYLLLQALIAVV
jgi:hypothetical protein